VKPSPVPSILLFVASAILAFSLFGRGWFTHSDDNFSFSGGPIRSEMCTMHDDEMECESNNIFSSLGKGRWDAERLVYMLFVLCGVAGLITSAIAGFLLLSKQRSALALVSLILVGLSLLLMLLSMFGLSKGSFSLKGISYGFVLYFVGAITGIVSAILAMVRGGGAPMAMRPGYPPGPAYGYGQPPMQGYPPGYGQPGGYAPQGYPPAGYPPAGYPPGAQPMAQPPQQQPQQPQQSQQPQQPAPQPAPEAQPGQAQAGPAHPACGTAMTWVAQYQRWYCTRCNQYS